MLLLSVVVLRMSFLFFFFFQAEDGIRYRNVTGVQTCALPIYEINDKTTRFSNCTNHFEKIIICHRNIFCFIKIGRARVGKECKNQERPKYSKTKTEKIYK